MNETVLQFGAGRFLRGFVDRFVTEINRSSNPIGKIVVVQSTAGSRAELLRECNGKFPVVIRGIKERKRVQKIVRVDSISRAVVASRDWSQVLNFATDPELRWIVSNATEAGYVCSETSDWQLVPETLPGKLTATLFARFSAQQAPVTILPCELIANNADRLRELVLEQANRWGLSADFQDYAGSQCLWLNNLVDCIVSDLPEDHPERQNSPLAITAEPYALLAIERPTGKTGPDAKTAEELLAPWLQHPAVSMVDSLAPYYLRKVRVLNGLHTAMVARFLDSPVQSERELETVLDVMRDPSGLRWTRDLLYGEILPTLISQGVTGAVEFADQTLERFDNPFLAHRLRDIRLNHEQKIPVRLVPTADDYAQLFGHRPPLLQAAIDRKLPS